MENSVVNENTVKASLEFVVYEPPLNTRKLGQYLMSRQTTFW